MDDPIERLKGMSFHTIQKDDMPDLSMHLKPLPDGIFPKKARLISFSTEEVVQEVDIEWKGSKGNFTITPPMSGKFILEMYPGDVESVTVNVEEPNERYPDC